MRRIARFLSLSTLAGLLAAAAVAEVRLPALFSDHAVLQQDSEVAIWGWAAPGERVEVQPSWDGKAVGAKTGADGKWSVRLRTPAAGGPFELTVRGRNEIKLSDVWTGEVWVCSGQSNMEMPVGYVSPGYPGAVDWEKELETADLPQLRLFLVNNHIAASPEADCKGTWKVCNAAAAREFSATGFFFGRMLHKELAVPVGLIAADWGGTPAESWTSADTIEKFPAFADALAEVRTLRETDPVELQRRHAEAISKWAISFEGAEVGSRGGWHKADFDDRDWTSMAVPGPWESAGAPADFDGVAWFRREVELPAAWAGRDLWLELGPIDDMDTTWFNGEPVGAFNRPGEWRTPRKYRVPGAHVRAGANGIAVRVFDTGGAGGMMGPASQLRVYPVDGSEGDAVSLAGQWRYKLGSPLSELRRPPNPPALAPHMPTTLYNGMIAPLQPYGIRGAIWYQGESNRTRARQYRELFPAMIADWRARWGRGDFPFYYVQIAPFRYAGDTGQAGELREAQRLALEMMNVGMAVTMDIGDPVDIHPRNKQEVGRRLGLWALATTYGRKLDYSGPLYREMKVEDGRVRVSFDHAEGLSTRDGKAPSHVELAGADGVFKPAEAKIEGQALVAWSDAVPEPRAIRYGWAADAEPNLQNAAGLPASSFQGVR